MYTPNPSARVFVEIQPPIGTRVRMSAFGKEEYGDHDYYSRNPYNQIARPVFLKAAYKAACPDWKEKLVKEYPDFEFVRKERTYASGQTICIDTAWGSADYAIVHSGHNEIILVNKEGFAPWTSAIEVADRDNITVAELNNIVGICTTWHGKVTDTRVAK